MASLQFWESCSQCIYFMSIYHCEVGLWLCGSPSLRWIVPSLHALPWFEPVILALVGGCISAALEETSSSGHEGHTFLQQFHSQYPSPDLDSEWAKLFETWRCSEGKDCVLHENNSTFNSNLFFSLFFFSFSFF